MVGGYYQDQKLSYLVAADVNALNPIALNPPVRLNQDGTALSGFGSVSLKPIATIEISGGARYSYEKKDISFFRVYPGTLSAAAGASSFVAGQQVPTTRPERTFHNVSPEATITWRPDRRLTAYFGWKRGFISGGFNGTSSGTAVATIGDFSYNQEVVEGFEGGLKATALDGALRFNLAAFSYKIKGLQGVSTSPFPPFASSITNAADATTKGVEADANWRTPLAGLSLRGALFLR